VTTRTALRSVRARAWRSATRGGLTASTIASRAATRTGIPRWPRLGVLDLPCASPERPSGRSRTAFRPAGSSCQSPTFQSARSGALDAGVGDLGCPMRSIALGLQSGQAHPTRHRWTAALLRCGIIDPKRRITALSREKPLAAAVRASGPWWGYLRPSPGPRQPGWRCGEPAGAGGHGGDDHATGALSQSHLVRALAALCGDMTGARRPGRRRRGGEIEGAVDPSRAFSAATATLFGSPPRAAVTSRGSGSRWWSV
jgi:hypothetical protein